MPGSDFRKGTAERERSGRSGLERERQIGIDQDLTNAASNETGAERLRGKRAGGTG